MAFSRQPRARQLRIALVLLAPVAALVGLYFAYRFSTASSLHLTISTRDVARITAAQAASKGIRTDGWRSLIDLKPNNDLRHYLTVTASPAQRASLERLLVPIPYRCTLENSSNPIDSVHATLAPDGRLISWRVPPAKAPPLVSVVAAKQAAEEELARRLGSERAGFADRGSGVEQHKGTASEVRTFTFKREYDRDLTLEAVVRTSGVEVIGFTLTPILNPAREKRFLELAKPFNTIRGSLVVVLFIAGFIFVVARFIRRLREQEIAFRRALLVVAIVFVAFFFSTLTNSQSNRIEMLRQGVPLGPAFDIIMLLVVSTFMAVLAGMIWGACEADLREAYPDKLASTDALPGGFFKSSAVRSSLAAGFTIAAWNCLASGTELALRHGLGAWVKIVEGELMPFQHGSPLVGTLMFALTGIPMLLAILLVAISATHRKGRTRAAQIALCLLMLLFFLLSSFGSHSPAWWSLIPAVVGAAVLLVPFLLADLVAVMTAIMVSTLATASASLLAQPSASHRTAGWTMLAGLVAASGLIAVNALRRREVHVDVEAARPEYARNITERLLLTREMEAAREAQLRVMPRVIPTVEGIALAAKHSAPKDIGADSYEFFTSPSHLSLAIADARLPGLSSALCISMLKGLLLNYASRLTGPRDIADRVHRQLSSIFGDDLPLSFFFGRIDRQSGELLFATFGEIPHAVHVRATSGPRATVIPLEGEEYVRLGAGAVVIYTAPLAGLRDRDGATLGDAAIHQALAASNRDDPQSLIDALTALASQHSRGVQEPLNWTAVSIAMSPAEGRS